MARPLVTVVMPTFNRLEYVRAAVASVYAQTFEDWELIVIDDGSGDETRRFLRSPPDPRMSVIFHLIPGSRPLVRNQGIARARGRYVAFLDSDDRWAAEKLQRQLALMESTPARRWSYTAVRRIDADGLRNPLAAPYRVFPMPGSILEQVLRVDAQIATPTVMAELAFVRELGGFDEKMRFVEDYDLWSRMALRSEVAVDTTPLADVRSHLEHFTSDRVGSLERLGQPLREDGNARPDTASSRPMSQAKARATFCRWLRSKRVPAIGPACGRPSSRPLARVPSVRCGWLRIARAAALPRAACAVTSDTHESD